MEELNLALSLVCQNKVGDIIERLAVLKSNSGSLEEQHKFQEMIDTLNDVYDVLVIIGV